MSKTQTQIQIQRCCITTYWSNWAQKQQDLRNANFQKNTEQSVVDSWHLPDILNDTRGFTYFVEHLIKF